MDSLVAELAFRKGAGGNCGFGVTADAVDDVPRGGNVKIKAAECIFQIFNSQVDFQPGDHLGLPFFVLSLCRVLLGFDAFIIFIIF